MFFLTKKIRRLIQMLESKKMPTELKEVVQAIEKQAPNAARPAFQRKLREQLMVQHKALMQNASHSKKVVGNHGLVIKNHLSGFKNLFQQKGWASAMALLMIVVLGATISYPFLPAPEVQGYSLKMSVRKISYNAPIKIVFSQPMDHGSVEKAFSIEPKIDGAMQWDRNTLLFVPKEQFKVGQSFTVSIKQSAKSLIQKQLKSEYVEIYNIVQAPTVLLFSPAPDSKDVPPDAKLTVHFDRPMTQLTTLDQGVDKAFQFVTVPELKGKYRWLGTSTLSFIPEKIDNATHYTVTIPKGTISAEGGQSDQDFSFGFDTLKPQVEMTEPNDLYPYAGDKTKFKITFNQRIVLDRAQAHVRLLKYNGKGLGEIGWDESGGMGGLSGTLQTSDVVKKMNPAEWSEVGIDKRVYSIDEFKKENNNVEGLDLPKQEDVEKVLVVQPQSNLAWDAAYLLKIDKDFQGAEGTFTLGEDRFTLIKTVGELKIIGSDPVQNYENFSGSTVSIKFSQPIDNKEIASKVTIEPQKIDKITNKPAIPQINTEGNDLVINYGFKPSTEYTIKIASGVQDTFGNLSAEGYVLKFKTAALQPGFDLQMTEGLSILDINKPLVYYVKSTNIDFVHINFKALSFDEFKQIYQNGYVNINNVNLTQGEMRSWDKNLSNKFNERIVSKIDLGKENGGELAPGYYYFDISNPLVKSNYNDELKFDRQIMIVTGSALATKLSNDQLLVWATDLKNGAPQAGMDISVRADGMADVIYSGKTDKDGLLTFKLTDKGPGESRRYFVEGRKDNDFTFTQTGWAEGIDSWNFGVNYGVADGYHIYAYTDRPIYRPENTVYFKGILRKNIDSKYSLPDVKIAHVTVRDSQYTEVFSKDVEVNANGSFSGEFTLAKNVALGQYNMNVTLPTQKQSGGYYNAAFRVTEYRKPDYQLSVKPDKNEYVNSETAKVKVKAAYFFGAPLPNAPVEWTVRSNDYYYFIDNDSGSSFANKWYSFSNEGQVCMEGNCGGSADLIGSGKAVLDGNGEFTIEVPLNVNSKKLSQMLTVEASVTDVNHQSIASRAAMIVHAGEYYVGIESNYNIVKTGEDTKFNLITVDAKGMPVVGKSLEAKFYRRNWDTVKKKNVDSGYYFENNFEDVLIETKTAVSDSGGNAAVTFKPKEGGYYKLLTESKDSLGNSITAASFFYVSSGEFVNWGRENNDRIELVADKQQYNIGDTAHILVKSPYQNVYALLTTETAGIQTKKVIKLKSNSDTIDVPVTEKALPNIFVSLLLVKGSSSNAGLPDPGNEVDERDVAAFKMGLINLQVNTQPKKLNIEIKADKQKYHPGDEVTINVKTTDIAGKPQKADLSLSVVDESVLSLTENITADLLKDFYSNRWLGVMTATNLTKALARVNVQVESGLKGGGGGAIAKRGVFKDTAYWNATLITDQNGDGVIKFKLPDNLTSWQLLAIGATKDTLVGSQKINFKVTKDVLVRPVLPRFLIINDVVKFGAIVHNYLDTALDLKVKLEASGIEIKGGNEKWIKLNPGEEKLVEFDVVVKDEAESKMTISALNNDGSIGDILEQTLPIHTFSFPEVVATSGVVIDGSKHVETVWLPTGIDPKFGELTISAASTLAGSIKKGLEYLTSYPYGCVEQVTSALLPNLAVKQITNLPGMNSAVDQKKLEQQVITGLQSLYKYQQAGGGWGIWENSQPTPYLSSYVIYTLQQAKNAGYSVDENVLKRGTDYVKNAMKNRPLNKGNRYDANTRAYALFVLAEIGQGDLGLSNNVYEFKDDLNLFSKAYLVMTYQTLEKKLAGAVKAGLQSKMTTLKQEILNGAKETVRGIHFEEMHREYRLFDTNNRTTAIILQMLAREDINHPFVQKILRFMMMERKDGHYSTTQETAISLLAMAEYLKISKEFQPNFNGIVEVNGNKVMDGSFGEKNLDETKTVKISLKDLLQDNQDNEIVSVRDGAGRMYTDINLKYYLPTEKIAARDEGIVVNQEYFSVDDKKMEQPIEKIKVGENLLAKMTVVVPEDRHFVMVEDFLPAGIEGVDFSLQTSQQDLQNNDSFNSCKGVYTWDCYQGASWMFNHSEVRDDRVMYFADFLPKGIYEIKYFVRATTPGSYHDLPALAQETYFPEVFGRSNGRMFEVLQ